jgi:hypothetical protein
VHPPDPASEPLPNNAHDLHTSEIPNDVNIEDSIEDSQGESPSSQATLDILLYKDTDTYMQEPPMLREPSPVSKQLHIPLDGQEPVPISSGEIKLWVYDDPHAPPAVRNNPTLAGHTRPSSPSSPDSPAASVCRRITSGGRYKVPLLLPLGDDTTPV